LRDLFEGLGINPVNYPEEIRAFMQQIVHEVLSYLGKFPEPNRIQKA
jgi:hypothetical protein